ncbi:hypothetical protein QBC40DRAFT_323492 [Triangularia verruculosa]|uniref:Cytochrome P450 n=1 Tax=Triangularia verruculosa TaxID=2587418 RepID=A0AAN7B049_9PEZI|nr:hypothetical protein QBC40DRAFT_323492 [Triangularia verruculosa]
MASKVTLGPVLAATTAASIGSAKKFDLPTAQTVGTALAAALPLYLFVWLSYLYPLYFSDLRHVPTVPGNPLWEPMQLPQARPRQVVDGPHLGEGVLLAEGNDHEKPLIMAKLWKDEMTVDNLKAGSGYDINSLEDPDVPIREAYRLVFAFDLFSRLLHGMQAFIPASKHIPAKMNRDMETARGIILEKATEIISTKLDESRKQGRRQGHLGSHRKGEQEAQGKRPKKASRSTPCAIRFMTFLRAGHDTTATANTMPFLFDPSTRTDDSFLAAADPDKLPFMDNVPGGTVIYVLANTINRLPTFWGGGGRARMSLTRIGGMILPQTAVVPNAFMTFLQAGAEGGALGGSLPRRRMKILLCVLLSEFEFVRDYDTPDPEEWKMWRLVLRPKGGVTVRATRLQQGG